MSINKTRAASLRMTPTGGVGRLLIAQIAAECRQTFRVQEQVVGVVAVPVILYAMFALPTVGERLPGGTDVPAMLVGSFGAYAVVSTAIFTFGVDVAAERDQGWLRRLRVTPMPMWVYFVAKVLMAAVMIVVILAALWLLAVTVGGAHVSVTTVLSTSTVLLAGVVAFSTMGFALAFVVRPKAAAAIGNLVFLPLSFSSGFFLPLGSLPDVVRALAPWLPTSHFGNLVWRAGFLEDDVVAFTGGPLGPIWTHVAWVVVAFAVSGAVLGWAYSRDRHRERG